MTETCIFGAGAIGGLMGAKLAKGAKRISRSLLAGRILEAQAVGEAPGVRFPVDVDDRMEMAAKVGAAGLGRRPAVRADALLGVVIELAQMTGIATPALKLVYDLVRFRARLGTLEPSDRRH